MDIAENMPEIEYVPSSSPVIQSITPPIEPLQTDFPKNLSMPSPSHGLQTIRPVHESSPYEFRNSSLHVPSPQGLQNLSPVHVPSPRGFQNLSPAHVSPHELQNLSPVPVPSPQGFHSLSPAHASPHALRNFSPSPTHLTSTNVLQNINPVYVPQVLSPADFQAVSLPRNISASQDISYITLKGYSPLSQGTISNLPSTATYAPPYQQNNVNYFDSLDFYGRQHLHSDEGLGSSPSSLDSISPPIIKEECIQPLASQILSSGSMQGYFFNDPGFALTKSIGDFPLPNQQCVKCGGSSSRYEMWISDSTGNYLCFNCSTESAPVEVPRGFLPASSEDERQKRPVQKRRKHTAATKKGDLQCNNCKTETTTLWRRSPEGDAVCNSCGLYQRVNHRPRPVTMRKDVIQRRKRKPRSGTSKKKIIPTTEVSLMPEASPETGVLAIQHAGPSGAAHKVRLPSLHITMNLN